MYLLNRINNRLYYNMGSLEFENFDMEKPALQEPSPEEVDPYIEYSLKVVDYLQAKLSEYNKKDEAKRTSLDQLKRVFINSAASYEKNKNYTINEYAFARVNMFLAIRAGRSISYDTKNVNPKSLLDASSIIVPIEEDYKKTKKDIVEYELGLDFESINNLYIYTKEDKIKTAWE